ncbi:PE-PGRS family protein [Mycobacterium tuberculosis str. Beijing/NITR203]|nr:PE-PGRS family protein [Mycobacterium tuberculosis str. Beijing/NITR203]
MSFVIAQPEMIAAAAGELASIRSAINAANAAAAAQTTGVMSAAADEVSTAVAALFSSLARPIVHSPARKRPPTPRWCGP